MTREETPKFGMSKAIDEFEKGLTAEDIKNAPFAMVEQAIRFGGEWKKKKIEGLGITREDYTKAINECIFGEEEPASKDLEEEIKKMQRHYKTIEEYDGQYAPLYASDIEHIARHFAGWQKVKDEKWLQDNHKKIYNNGWDEGFGDGRDSMEEDMMKDVVEAEYWDGSLFKNELRERFKDGDMVKLIIVKEE